MQPEQTQKVEGNSVVTITEYDDPRLDIFTRLSEVQLLRYREPGLGIFLAESPKVIERAMDAGYEPVAFLAEKSAFREDEQRLCARFPEISVYVAENEVFEQMRGFQLTRGMLCAMNRKRLPSVAEVCAKARRIAVLWDVVNPTNVGAIIRSAAALGMDGVICTTDGSDPLYRRAIRVSMGTVFQIPWTIMDAGDWPERAMQELRSMGYRTAAMALKEDSVSLKDERLKKEERLAIVLGTEGDGLAGRTIADCDYTVMIPMAHGVDSLNVAAASAVAFWELDPLFLG